MQIMLNSRAFRFKCGLVYLQVEAAGDSDWRVWSLSDKGFKQKEIDVMVEFSEGFHLPV